MDELRETVPKADRRRSSILKPPVFKHMTIDDVTDFENLTTRSRKLAASKRVSFAKDTVFDEESRSISGSSLCLNRDSDPKAANGDHEGEDDVALGFTTEYTNLDASFSMLKSSYNRVHYNRDTSVVQLMDMSISATSHSLNCTRIEPADMDTSTLNCTEYLEFSGVNGPDVDGDELSMNKSVPMEEGTPDFHRSQGQITITPVGNSWPSGLGFTLNRNVSHVPEKSDDHLAVSVPCNDQVGLQSKHPAVLTTHPVNLTSALSNAECNYSEVAGGTSCLDVVGNTTSTVFLDSQHGVSSRQLINKTLVDSNMSLSTTINEALCCDQSSSTEDRRATSFGCNRGAVKIFETIGKASQLMANTSDQLPTGHLSSTNNHPAVVWPYQCTLSSLACNMHPSISSQNQDWPTTQGSPISIGLVCMGADQSFLPLDNHAHTEVSLKDDTNVPKFIPRDNPCPTSFPSTVSDARTDTLVAGTPADAGIPKMGTAMFNEHDVRPEEPSMNCTALLSRPPCPHTMHADDAPTCPSKLLERSDCSRTSSLCPVLSNTVPTADAPPPYIDTTVDNDMSCHMDISSVSLVADSVHPSYRNEADGRGLSMHFPFDDKDISCHVDISSMNLPGRSVHPSPPEEAEKLALPVHVPFQSQLNSVQDVSKVTEQSRVAASCLVIQHDVGAVRSLPDKGNVACIPLPSTCPLPSVEGLASDTAASAQCQQNVVCFMDTSSAEFQPVTWPRPFQVNTATMKISSISSPNNEPRSLVSTYAGGTLPSTMPHMGFGIFADSAQTPVRSTAIAEPHEQNTVTTLPTHKFTSELSNGVVQLPLEKLASLIRVPFEDNNTSFPMDISSTNLLAHSVHPRPREEAEKLMPPLHVSFEDNNTSFPMDISSTNLLAHSVHPLPREEAVKLMPSLHVPFEDNNTSFPMDISNTNLLAHSVHPRPREEAEKLVPSTHIPFRPHLDAVCGASKGKELFALGASGLISHHVIDVINTAHDKENMACTASPPACPVVAAEEFALDTAASGKSLQNSVCFMDISTAQFQPVPILGPFPVTEESSSLISTRGDRTLPCANPNPGVSLYADDPKAPLPSVFNPEPSQPNSTVAFPTQVFTSELLCGSVLLPFNRGLSTGTSRVPCSIGARDQLGAPMGCPDQPGMGAVIQLSSTVIDPSRDQSVSYDDRAMADAHGEGSRTPDMSIAPFEPDLVSTVHIPRTQPGLSGMVVSFGTAEDSADNSLCLEHKSAVGLFGERPNRPQPVPFLSCIDHPTVVAASTSPVGTTTTLPLPHSSVPVVVGQQPEGGSDEPVFVGQVSLPDPCLPDGASMPCNTVQLQCSQGGSAELGNSGGPLAMQIVHRSSPGGLRGSHHLTSQESEADDFHLTGRGTSDQNLKRGSQKPVISETRSLHSAASVKSVTTHATSRTRPYVTAGERASKFIETISSARPKTVNTTVLAGSTAMGQASRVPPADIKYVSAAAESSSNTVVSAAPEAECVTNAPVTAAKPEVACALDADAEMTDDTTGALQAPSGDQLDALAVTSSAVEVIALPVVQFEQAPPAIPLTTSCLTSVADTQSTSSRTPRPTVDSSRSRIVSSAHEEAGNVARIKDALDFLERKIREESQEQVRSSKALSEALAENKRLLHSTSTLSSDLARLHHELCNYNQEYARHVEAELEQWEELQREECMVTALEEFARCFAIWKLRVVDRNTYEYSFQECLLLTVWKDGRGAGLPDSLLHVKLEVVPSKGDDVWTALWGSMILEEFQRRYPPQLIHQRTSIPQVFRDLSNMVLCCRRYTDGIRRLSLLREINTGAGAENFKRLGIVFSNPQWTFRLEFEAVFASNCRSVCLFKPNFVNICGSSKAGKLPVVSVTTIAIDYINQLHDAVRSRSL